MAGESGAGTEISGLVNTLQGHVDDIRSQLQCGICIRLLYEPFTLACGHTFCYSCLTSWFSGGRSKRTCPDCRAPVKAQPAPAYLVRTVVQMFTSRAELLDKGETTAEHLTHRQEESGKLDRDKTNTDPSSGGLFQGLFKEKPHPLQPIIDQEDGVVRCPICNWELADDEVCAGCGYAYHGESDGTDYTDEDSDELSETEDHDSFIEDEADDDGFEGIEDDDEVWGTFAVPGSFPRDLDGAPHGGIPLHDLLPQFYHPGTDWRHRQWPAMEYRPPRPRPGVILTDPSEYDEHYDDEENEYDEMDSFIDNDEYADRDAEGSQSEHSTVVGSHPDWQSGNSRAPIILSGTVSSDEDEDEDEDGEEEEEDFDDEDEDGVVRRPSRRIPTFYESDEEEEDSEIEEDEDDSMTSQEHQDTFHDSHPFPIHDSEAEDGDDPVSRSRFFPHVIEDDAVEESELSEMSSPPPSRPTRPARPAGVSFGNTITIDDSEDEQPVGPVRRTTQRRRARFSPY